MRHLFGTGSFTVLGEVVNQYDGVAPGDERMAPYWALAEELDVPVAIHLGEGLPKRRIVPGSRQGEEAPSVFGVCL